MLLWVQHYNLPIRFCAAAAIAPIVSIPMTERCRPAKGCRKNVAKMLPPDEEIISFAVKRKRKTP